MRKSLTKSLQLFALFVITAIAITSCSSTRKIKYFQDIPDSGQLKNIPVAKFSESQIQSDDILTVVVELIDPNAAMAINLGNLPTGSTGLAMGNGSANMLTQQVSNGYLVNKDGIINLPILGKIKVGGLTLSQASAVIDSEAVKYYKSPTVIVRYANFKITVTGEVLKPGVYIMPSEKTTILDAIAVAGDLTIFGKRENVLLIRENPDGTKTPYRVNLKKSDVMSAPYYYLKQND
jgi:polysaccharide export outer membrane protein